MSRDEFLNWDRSEIEGSEVDEQGWLTVQVNAYGEGAARSGMLLHSPYGLLGRPPDPDDKGACKALTAREGDQDHAIATVDLRVLKKLPRPKKGGSVQFGSDGGFGSFDPEEHTWTLYIPVEFDSTGTPTKAHLYQIGKDTNGLRCVTLLHSDGQGLSMLSGGKRSAVLKNAASNVYIEVNDEGIVLNGKVTIKGGLKSDEGAGVVPLARSNELLAWTAALTTALNAVIAKVNALPPVTTIPPVLPLSPSVASFSMSG
jgi:hypothetical protein